MSGSTISSHVYHSVTLGSPGYLSPLSITNTGAIYGSANAAALYIPIGITNPVTITNSGLIEASSGGGLKYGGTFDYGVRINSATTFTNDGQIVGGNAIIDTISSEGFGYRGGVGFYMDAKHTTLTNNGGINGGNGVSNGNYRVEGGDGIFDASVHYANSGIINTRSGNITGGSGSNIDIRTGYRYGYGGYGGTGVYIEHGTLKNSGHIAGGSGGAALDAAEYGGRGGVGVSLLTVTMTNIGVISGGAGGAGAKYGGIGGVGLRLTGERFLAPSHVSNAGIIYGGAGGYGALKGGAGAAGLSSYGQAGLYHGSTINSGINLGEIIGGAGGGAGSGGVLGRGGYGANFTGFYSENEQYTFRNFGLIAGGAGSAGGIGVAADRTTLDNHGVIKGGENFTDQVFFHNRIRYGSGVFDSDSCTNYGLILGGAGAGAGANHGINGGTGVDVSYGILVNDGRITGGAGGSGVDGGDGGDGVYISSGILTNAGTISAGSAGSGSLVDGSSGDAVQFSKKGGTLIVDPGAVFNGKVVALSAAVLELNGTSAVALSGIGTEFTGFEHIEFAASSQWAIAGTTAGLTTGQKITGFGAGDAIKLSNAAAGTGTVTVGTAGTVSIDAGGVTYNLDIAGATVGETTFTFSNYTLTESDPPAMAFLRPAAIAGQPAQPSLAALLQAPEQLFSSIQPTHWFTAPTLSATPLLGATHHILAEQNNPPPIVTLQAW